MQSARVLLAAMLWTSGVDAQTPRYREGQVWAYRTRPGDAGSLLKIQRIEQQGGRQIYHISIIGVHFHTPGITGMLPHEPVSQETLDRSVTEQHADPGTFPSADQGIAEWRRARGGVFTVTVAETLDFTDRVIAQQAGSAP